MQDLGVLTALKLELGCSFLRFGSFCFVLSTGIRALVTLLLRHDSSEAIIFAWLETPVRFLREVGLQMGFGVLIRFVKLLDLFRTHILLEIRGDRRLGSWCPGHLQIFTSGFQLSLARYFRVWSLGHDTLIDLATGKVQGL